MRPAGLRARERPGAGGSSGGESRELWAAPGGSVAAPERSGKVAGGLGWVLVGSGEVLGGLGGVRGVIRRWRMSGLLRGRKVGRYRR